MPNWLTINKENHKDHCLGIITSKMSNLTVIDFDDPAAYDQMVLDFPEFKHYKTIKTSKGYHVYCLYDESIKTTTNAMIVYDKVDIKNDGGMVFAPPTRYNLLDGTIVKYEDMGGNILPIPDILIKNLKQNQQIPAPAPAPTPAYTPAPAPTSASAPAPAQKRKYKLIVKNKPEGQDGHKVEINDLEKFRLFSQCYSKNRLSDYDS